LRALLGPADLGKRFPTGDKLAEKRKEESLAEPPDGWFGLKVEGAADDIAVEFIEDDPEPQICYRGRTAVSLSQGFPRRNEPSLAVS
jgi:hypothetical protein